MVNFLFPKDRQKRHIRSSGNLPGGSVLAGETSVQGAVREVWKELGIKLDPEKRKLLCSGHRQYPNRPDILDVWIFDCDAPVESVTLQKGETINAKYADIEEIRRMVYDGTFIEMNEYNYLSYLGKR